MQQRICAAQEGREEGGEEAFCGTIQQHHYHSFSLLCGPRRLLRYLSTEQALRYLRRAGADLAVAVQLGEHQQFGPKDRHSPDLCCGRTQFALKVAAAKAEHPEPDDLSRLAKSLAPFKDPKPLAAVLQKGQLLSVDDVNSVVSSLQRQHYAASPAVQVSFLRRPHPDFDQGFGLPGQQPSKFSVVGENYVADVAISRYDGAVSSICDLRSPNEMKQMLFNCLNLAATTIGKCCSPHMTRDLATAPPMATCECEHIRYLKMCLADTIHAFYIKALSLLPHYPLHKHFRGILVAGHCYGPMDPVSNIILNAIWYDTVYPLPEIDAEIEPDILDSKSLLRMEVRSLNGLVTMFCTATGLSGHNAVEYLCYKQCDLSVLQMASQQTTFKAYDCAGQAGKHPKHSELASFLVSKCSNDIEGLRTLLTHETTGKSYVISDASLEQVHKIVGDQSTVPSVGRPRLCPMAWTMLGSRKLDFVQQQRFLRQILDELLLDYSNQHPWVII